MTVIQYAVIEIRPCSYKNGTNRHCYVHMHTHSLSQSLSFLPAVAGFVHEAPLHAGREASSSSPSQTRHLDLIQDPVCPLQEDLFSLIPVTPTQSTLQTGNTMGNIDCVLNRPHSPNNSYVPDVCIVFTYHVFSGRLREGDKLTRTLYGW